MGLKGTLDSIWLNKQFVAVNPAATRAAGAQTIFTITGGLVILDAIIMYHDTTVAGATTITTVINGVATSGDAGALTMAGIAGTITVLPLGNVAMVAPTACQPIPSLLASAGFMFGRLAGSTTGLIITTFGGAAMGALEQVSFRCIYRKVDAAAAIN